MVEHAGGFLPFQADISSALFYGNVNRITVALNNTLSPSTLPQGNKYDDETLNSTYYRPFVCSTGSIRFFDNEDRYPPGYNIQEYEFDWFNFAGKMYIVSNEYVAVL